jgi:hypothetical protein
MLFLRGAFLLCCSLHMCHFFACSLFPTNPPIFTIFYASTQNTLTRTHTQTPYSYTHRWCTAYIDSLLPYKSPQYLCVSVEYDFTTHRHTN